VVYALGLDLHQTAIEEIIIIKGVIGVDAVLYFYGALMLHHFIIFLLKFYRIRLNISKPIP
jgi:hypothetical protein